jgi:hypothetical protein
MSRLTEESSVRWMGLALVLIHSLSDATAI